MYLTPDHAKNLQLSLNAATFARSVFKFHPDPHQSTVLSTSIRRGLLNCCRQWGKSTVTAIKAVHRAHFYPGSLTLVLSPSAPAATATTTSPSSSPTPPAS